jgi:hypothetical protein
MKISMTAPAMACLLLAAGPAAAISPRRDCTKSLRDGTQTDWQCLQKCPENQDAEVKPADAQMCQIPGGPMTTWPFYKQIDIAYPVLDPKTDKVSMKKAPLSATSSAMPPDAAAGWKKFKDDRAMLAFPKETRGAVSDLFDKNKIQVVDGQPPADVGPCGDGNGSSAKGTSMTNALSRTCFTEKDGAKTYSVPSGVDCKTGAVAWTDNSDRSAAMTAVNSFRIASNVCSDAKLAPMIHRGKDEVIGDHKIGALVGDRSKGMKVLQGQLNQFLKDAKAKNALPDDAPTALVEDGKRGDNTRNAILMFQAANQLPQTGVMDAGTMKGLNDQFKSQRMLPKGFRAQPAPPPPPHVDNPYIP